LKEKHTGPLVTQFEEYKKEGALNFVEAGALVQECLSVKDEEERVIYIYIGKIINICRPF